MIMLLLFGAVLALVVLNVPIAVALGVVAIVAMVSTHGTDILPNLKHRLELKQGQAISWARWRWSPRA